MMAHLIFLAIPTLISAARDTERQRSADRTLVTYEKTLTKRITFSNSVKHKPETSGGRRRSRTTRNYANENPHTAMISLEACSQ